MEFINDFVVDEFAGDGFEGYAVFGFWLHCEHNGHAFAWFAVEVADTAGMYHVVAFVVVFNVADVWREEFCTAFFPVLPDLFDGHLVGCRCDSARHGRSSGS